MVVWDFLHQQYHGWGSMFYKSIAMSLKRLSIQVCEGWYWHRICISCLGMSPHGTRTDVPQQPLTKWIASFPVPTGIVQFWSHPNIELHKLHYPLNNPTAKKVGKIKTFHLVSINVSINCTLKTSKTSCYTMICRQRSLRLTQEWMSQEFRING